jgi:hypothetical protein
MVSGKVEDYIGSESRKRLLVVDSDAGGTLPQFFRYVRCGRQAPGSSLYLQAVNPTAQEAAPPQPPDGLRSGSGSGNCTDLDFASVAYAAGKARNPARRRVWIGQDEDNSERRLGHLRISASQA